VATRPNRRHVSESGHRTTTTGPRRDRILFSRFVGRSTFAENTSDRRRPEKLFVLFVRRTCVFFCVLKIGTLGDVCRVTFNTEVIVVVHGYGTFRVPTVVVSRYTPARITLYARVPARYEIRVRTTRVHTLYRLERVTRTRNTRFRRVSKNVPPPPPPPWNFRRFERALRRPTLEVIDVKTSRTNLT